MLKCKDKVVHPQNIYGGVGGHYFPGPGIGGALPSPEFFSRIGFGLSGFCTLSSECALAGPIVWSSP
ncbi:hypothetical protein ACJRO7_020321 [Eucalyptus globulus]|uniref:Uncharacterized protein n=1 Tax=Eucalyptus globulus TaxID=34317 RepID=A0ABD3KG64_EUCGL